MKPAQKLKQLLNATGISQGRLAKMIGVSRAAVSAWERGKASPQLTNYEAALDILLRIEALNKDEK